MPSRTPRVLYRHVLSTGGDQRRCTGMDQLWNLVATALVVLVIVVAVAGVGGWFVLRKLASARPAPPAETVVESPAVAVERQRHEATVASLRAAADDASAAVDQARTESATARAEAVAAHAEAQRVLAAAKAE